MPRAPVNGQRVNFRDSGGPGPALVFCHGRMAVIAGAGHASNPTHAAQVNAQMGPFLQRTRADWVDRKDKGDRA